MVRNAYSRYLIWLAAGTTVMAIAMATLLGFVIAQKNALGQNSSLRADSLTAMVFQFEREFLRFRQTLEHQVHVPHSADTDALSLRYDIFVSRFTLLRDSPSVAILQARTEYSQFIPRMAALLQATDAALLQSPLDSQLLATLLDRYQSMGPEVQTLSLAADSEVARRLENQNATMLQQNSLIVWLTLAQLVMLLVAAFSLALRQKRQDAERLALQQLTEELREARAKAEAANRGKSQFLANMSHELRTPFNGLIGMLGLLAGTPVNAQQVDYIRTAQGSAKHLLMLLNDILDVSALDAGKMTLRPAPAHLQLLIADIDALMRPQAEGKGLRFSMQLPHSELPWVLVDDTRFKQIAFNLISNAIKFTSQGSVSVVVSDADSTTTQCRLTISVQDSGIGMGPQALGHLFQRFQQVDSGIDRKYGGTGLGLEISQSLAKMMDGEILVTSVEGSGSTFTLRLNLPRCEEPVPVATQEDTSQQAQGGIAAVAPRILVVEDHPVNQKLVGVLLGRMGCQVTFCENGQLAVDIVQQQTFDLILMDVNMPVMDGLTATRMIRAMPGMVAEIPIVVFTADVMNEAQDRAADAGASGFLAKPVQIAQLQEVVRKYTAKPASV